MFLRLNLSTVVLGTILSLSAQPGQAQILSSPLRFKRLPSSTPSGPGLVDLSVGVVLAIHASHDDMKHRRLAMRDGRNAGDR